MIKVEALIDFNLKDFNKITNIVRKEFSKSDKGKLYKGDTFEATEEMVKYLTGGNDKKVIAVKVIEETIKEEEVEIKKEIKVDHKKSNKKK